MVLCCSVTTAEVSVHVDTSPPIAVSSEENIISELNRANRIVDRLKDTSTEVIQLMCQLKPGLSRSYERAAIQDQLKEQFEAALYQTGFSPRIVTEMALMCAHNAAKDIKIVIAKHGH